MINGKSFLNSIISGTNNILNHKELVDKLNIFPVPDGDTGTNMSMTMQGAVRDLDKMSESNDIGNIAQVVASSLLRAARGNSGVILSVIFRGFAKGLAGLDAASGRNLAEALSCGVDAAYKTVMKPTEGTMLTVARVAYERGMAASYVDNDPTYVWEEICKGASDALDMTPELLPVLKKAGVVDAGGKGLCLIFEGMMSVFRDGTVIPSGQAPANEVVNNMGDDFESLAARFDEEINYTYCTEYIVGRSAEITLEPSELRCYLETIGDSVVVVDDSDIIKVHVHTDQPGLALEEGLCFGELLTVKVENMREQNLQMQGRNQVQAVRPLQVEPTEEIGFVSVAAGQGICTLFRDLGCMQVVSGGQTMNPSTEEIIEAVLATPAKTVFVLPNNKNIILSAEQTVDLVTDRKVVVLRSRTIPQGLSAMLSYDPEKSVEENAVLMTETMEGVETGQITTASKDYEYGGFKVREGELIAIHNGRPVHRFRDHIKGALKLVQSMASKETSFITIIYGENISENDAQVVYRNVLARFGTHVDVTLINGGQPVYHFIISVE